MGTLLARVMVMGAQPFWVVSGPSPLNQAGDRFRADSATDAGPESGGAAFRFRPGTKPNQLDCQHPAIVRGRVAEITFADRCMLLLCASHESLLDRSTLNWATKIAQTNPASISTANKNVE